MENREIFDNKSILGDCNCVKQVSVVKRFDFFDEGLAFSMEREAERTIFGRGNAAWHRHRDDCICQRVVQMVRSMCNFCLFVCLFVYLFPPSLFLCFPPYFMFLLLLLLLFFFCKASDVDRVSVGRRAGKRKAVGVCARRRQKGSFARPSHSLVASGKINTVLFVPSSSSTVVCLKGASCGADACSCGLSSRAAPRTVSESAR